MMNYTCGVTSGKNTVQRSNLSLLRKTSERYRFHRKIDLIKKSIFLDIRFQLNEQLKYLEQRIETQLAILSEIQEYFRRRADVELDYAKNLDNLHKQIGQKHRAQKAR